MPNDNALAELEAKYLDIKKVAGDHSANVHRLKQDLGAAQDRVTELEAEVKELEAVREDLKTSEAALKTAQKQLEKAEAEAELGRQAVESAKAVSENLAKLQSL